MKGTIIVFRILRHTSLKHTNQFCKKFYGQNTSTHQGRYKYRRKGFLDEIPHIRVIRGVIVIPKECAKKVTKFLRIYRAEVYAKEIALTDKERVILRRSFY